jgi:hypothetical protein
MQYFHHQMVEYHIKVRKEELQDSKHRPKWINEKGICFFFQKSLLSMTHSTIEIVR